MYRPANFALFSNLHPNLSNPLTKNGLSHNERAQRLPSDNLGIVASALCMKDASLRTG